MYRPIQPNDARHHQTPAAVEMNVVLSGQSYIAQNRISNGVARVQRPRACALCCARACPAVNMSRAV